MSELASEIRRIARGDKLKGPLSGTKERDPIPGTFVPFTNTPLNQITNNGAEGEDPVDVNSPPSNGAGEDPTDTDNQNDQPTDGNDPNTFNKGSATQGSTSNTYDVEDVIDQTGDVPTSPNEPDYTNSDEGSTSGVIDHMNGATDCNTGQCINFHTDGNFPAPEGWDDADTPPPVNDFEAGYRWYVTGSPYTDDVNHYFETPKIALPELIATYNARPDYRDVELLATIGLISENIFRYQFAGEVNNGFGWTGSGILTVDLNKSSCTIDVDDRCPATAPSLNDQWPEDGCYDLALIDGQFQKNARDGEAPVGAGGSKVNFCFGSGRQGTMETTANGGFMVYETSGGAPTGRATVYGNDGTFQAAGDATDTFMDQWRPK